MLPNVGIFNNPHYAYPKLLPRFGHTLELDHHSGTIWVFGGFSHTFNSALNDIRAFDTLEEKWIPITVQIPSTHVEKKSKSLSHRSKRKHQMKSKPIKRGKQNNRNKIIKLLSQQDLKLKRRRYKRWLSSVPRLSLLSSSISSSSTSASPKVLGPSARYFHASALIAAEKSLYIQGGMNITHYLNDFWRFNLIQRSWKKLPTTWSPNCCNGVDQISSENEVRIKNPERLFPKIIYIFQLIKCCI